MSIKIVYSFRIRLAFLNGTGVPVPPQPFSPNNSYIVSCDLNSVLYFQLPINMNTWAPSLNKDTNPTSSPTFCISFQHTPDLNHLPTYSRPNQSQSSRSICLTTNDRLIALRYPISTSTIINLTTWNRKPQDTIYPKILFILSGTSIKIGLPSVILGLLNGLFALRVTERYLLI